MYIPKSDIALAMKVAENKKNEASVRINQRDLEEFKKSLRGIIGKEKPRDGWSLRYDSDLFEAMKNAYQTMLSSVAKSFGEHGDNFRKDTDLYEYMRAANNYLAVIMLDELKNPSIDLLWSGEHEPELLKNAVEEMNKVKPREAISQKETFDNQRRKDAQELRNGRVGRLLNKMDNFGYTHATNVNAPTNEEISELYAEYRALEQRQKNHNGFWRFFHDSENEARNTLLEEMKNALNKRDIPFETLNDPSVTPADILGVLECQQASTAIAMDGAYRFKMCDKNIGYNVYKDNPDLLKELGDYQGEYEKAHGNELQNKLKDSLNEKKDVQIEGKREDPPVKSAPENSIN